MKYCIIDIKTNEQVDKIYCLSYKLMINKKELSSGTLIEYNEMKDFILSQKVLVGHDIIRHHIPVLEKVLSIEKINAKIMDTKAVSYYYKTLKPTSIKTNAICGKK